MMKDGGVLIKLLCGNGGKLYDKEEQRRKRRWKRRKTRIRMKDGVVVFMLYNINIPVVAK